MYRILIQLISAVLLWICCKLAINSWADPINYSFQSFFISAFFIFLYWKITSSIKLIKVNKKYFGQIFLVSFIIWWILNILSFLMYKYNNLTTISFLNQSSVFFSVIIWICFFKEKKYIKEWGIIILLFLWLYLFATSWKWFNINNWIFLIISSAFFSSLLMAWSQKILKKVDSITYWFYRALLISMAVFCYVLIFWKIQIQDYKFLIIQWFLSSISMISLNNAINKSSASELATISVLVPIITSMLAIFIFWDILNVIQIFWAFIIVISVFLLQYIKTKNHLKN